MTMYFVIAASFLAGTLVGAATMFFAVKREYLKKALAPRQSSDEGLDLKSVVVVVERVAETLAQRIMKFERVVKEVSESATAHTTAELARISQAVLNVEEAIREVNDGRESDSSPVSASRAPTGNDLGHKVTGRVPESAATESEQARTLEEIVADNFQTIDIQSKRHFETFRSRFLELLRSRAHDIQEEDGVVLFFESPSRAQAWPWPNGQLVRPWRDFFKLPKGAGHPVRSVIRPAIVEISDGEWQVTSKGAVEQ